MLFQSGNAFVDNSHAKSCGKVSNVIHYLQTLPEVFSVGIVWDSAEPSVTSIDIILRMISLRIDLNNVFVFGEPNKNSQMGARAKAPCYYRFRGMICYYGKHYVAYFYNFKSKLWYVYDDTNVQPVGSEWPMIRDRCLRGRLQPNIIFYEREGFDTVPDENFNPFQSIIDQDLAQLRISKVDLPLEEETKSEESDPEDSFVFIPREDSKEDVDIMVTRTNWLYRRKEIVFVFTIRPRAPLSFQGRRVSTNHSGKWNCQGELWLQGRVGHHFLGR